MNHKLRLTIFGDSIAVGQGVNITGSWVYKLASHFPNFFITNASQNGRTTRQALEIMPYEIQNHPPDLLIVQYGLNDSNYWLTDNGLPRVSRKVFKENLLEIHDRAINFDVKQVIYLTNHPTNKETVVHGKFYDLNATSYSEGIKEACEKLDNAIVVDTWKICANLADVNENKFFYLLDDGIHLNEIGHEIYYDAISEYFKNWSE